MLALVLLGLLYFDAYWGVRLLIGYLIFEGLTDLRVPLLALRLFPFPENAKAADGQATDALTSRISIEAEQILRLCGATILLLSVVFQPESLWWPAWFVAFTVLGAVVGGVCPVLNGLRQAGFR